MSKAGETLPSLKLAFAIVSDRQAENERVAACYEDGYIEVFLNLIYH